jgi:hypothetical protein
MREGDKGAKYFYYILFSHFGFNWEKWLHELLGRKAMWLFFSCNYINIPCGFFGDSLVLLHSLLHPSYSFMFGASFLFIHVLLV